MRQKPLPRWDHRRITILRQWSHPRLLCTETTREVFLNTCARTFRCRALVHFFRRKVKNNRKPVHKKVFIYRQLICTLHIAVLTTRYYKKWSNCCHFVYTQRFWIRIASRAQNFQARYKLTRNCLLPSVVFPPLTPTACRVLLRWPRK